MGLEAVCSELLNYLREVAEAFWIVCLECLPSWIKTLLIPDHSVNPEFWVESVQTNNNERLRVFLLVPESM